MNIKKSHNSQFCDKLLFKAARKKVPSTFEKIRILGENSKYDICASTASSRTEKYPNLFGDPKKSIGNTVSAGICHSYTPDGRCMSLFKTLFTNKCSYNCKYCFSHSCKHKMSFTPEEFLQWEISKCRISLNSL